MAGKAPVRLRPFRSLEEARREVPSISLSPSTSLGRRVRPGWVLPCDGRRPIRWSGRTLILGILNVNPRFLLRWGARARPGTGARPSPPDVGGGRGRHRRGRGIHPAWLEGRGRRGREAACVAGTPPSGEKVEGSRLHRHLQSRRRRGGPRRGRAHPQRRGGPPPRPQDAPLGGPLEGARHLDAHARDPARHAEKPPVWGCGGGGGVLLKGKAGGRARGRGGPAQPHPRPGFRVREDGAAQPGTGPTLGGTAFLGTPAPIGRVPQVHLGNLDGRRAARRPLGGVLGRGGGLRLERPPIYSGARRQGEVRAIRIAAPCAMGAPSKIEPKAGAPRRKAFGPALLGSMGTVDVRGLG
jgi:hypothetical protein